MFGSAWKKQRFATGLASTDAGASQGSFFQWTDPAHTITIELKLDVIDRLNRLAREAFQREPGRGLEIGGILLGYGSANEENRTVIEDFEVLECEHLRGPSFLLSGRDRKLLQQKLQRAAWKRGLTAVGFFRSHTRPGMYLDQDDFGVMQTYFADPRQVSLLVKPSADDISLGAFFFWEDGDIHRKAPYQQFPFDGKELASDGRRVVERRPDMPAPRRAAPSPITSRAPRTAASAIPMTAGGRRRSAKLMWMAVGIIAVLIGIAWLIAHSRSSSVTPSPGTGIALQVNRSGESLVLSWNRDAQVVRSSQRAVLWITDGGVRNRLDLDAAQLTRGRVVYFPTSRDVNFELELPARPHTISESVRAFSPGADAEAAPKPEASEVEAPPVNSEIAKASAPQLPARQEAPKAAPKPAAKSNARPSSPQPRAPRPFEASALAQSEPAAAEPDLSSLTPPELQPTGDLHAPRVTLGVRTVQHVVVTAEPLKKTGIRRTLRKIPGIGALAVRGEEGFLPPRAGRNLAPVIPPGVRFEPGSAVDLRVFLDSQGAVTRVETLSRAADPELVRLASYSARSTEFVPARLEGRPVPSEMILHFRISEGAP